MCCPLHSGVGAFLFYKTFMKNTLEHGCGVEAEGFICTRGSKQPRAKINGISSALWVIATAQREFPLLVPHLGLEQASIMLELRSSVHRTKEGAIDEVLAIRTQVNKILERFNTELLLMPVPPLSFLFEPATTADGSRTMDLVKLWGDSPEGKKMLIDTATASFQFNDSRPFKGISERDRLELTRRIHNQFTLEAESLLALNQGLKDIKGRTRVEIASELLKGVKGPQFTRRGFTTEHVTLPPFFRDVDHMQQWMCAHANLDDFSKVDSKDEHGLLCKVKRFTDGHPWIAEARFADSVDTRESMIHIATKVEEVLARAA